MKKRITIDLPESVIDYYEELAKASLRDRKGQIEYELILKATS